MPSLSTELTLRALVQVRLPGRGEGMVVGEAATFVAERWQQLSPFARQLVTLLVTLFALQCRLVTGRAFDRLDLVRRRWLVQRLAGGGPLGRLLEFVDPLVAIVRWRDQLPAPQPTVGRYQAAWSDTSAEVVVVGSGPGGALAAMLLAEAGIDTLLLEEGEGFSNGSLPAHSAYHLAGQLRHGGVSLAIGRPVIPFVEGRTLGGASEINSGLHLPPDPQVVANWQHQFGFDPTGLERAVDANRVLLQVSRYCGVQPEASHRLALAAERLGWHSIEPEQWRDQSDHWYDHLRAPYHTVTTHLLPRFLAAGGRIASSRRAVRLRREGGCWGVDGNGWRAQGQQLVVAGGAIQGPALLQRSALGQGVGEAISLQITLKVVARFDQPLNQPALGMGLIQIDHFAPQMRLGCAISTPAQLAIALRHHSGIRARLNRLHPFLLCYAVTLSATGRGELRQLPFYGTQLFYRLSREDWQGLATGLRRLCRLLLAAGASHIYPDIAPGPVVVDDAGLAALPSTLRHHYPGLQSLHLAGGCAMGADSERCPVDNRGALRGQTGIWIADASLLPANPGVNPQATVMALARRSAESIIAAAGRS